VKLFQASHRFESVAPDSGVRILFLNPSNSQKNAEIKAIETSSFGQSWIDIYRHTDASGGSDVPILNLHLGKSNNSSMTVKQGVTYTSGSLSHS